MRKLLLTVLAAGVVLCAGCSLHWAGREVISVDPLGEFNFAHPGTNTTPHVR